MALGSEIMLTHIQQCAGSSAILSIPSASPSLAITAANNTSTYVGQFTGTALSSGITSALNNACPSVATRATCTTATFVAGSDIPYPDAETEDGQGKGELQVIIQEGSFENGTMRDRLIAAAGRAAQQSTLAKGACYSVDFVTEELRGAPMTRKETVCNVGGEIVVNWYSGHNVYGPDDYIWAQFVFNGGPDAEDVTDEICEETMGAVDFLAALAAFFFPPAYLEDETIAKDIVVAGCDAAKAAEDVKTAVGGS